MGASGLLCTDKAVLALAIGMSKRSAENLWTYARTWLHREIKQQL